MTWRLTGIIVVVCSLILPACAQTDQWLDVEKLAPGTWISVVQRARQDCAFVDATDTELTCDIHIGPTVRRRAFARDRIQEIRLEIPGHNKLIVGAIIGAAAGGLIGFLAGHGSSDAETQVASPAVGIIAGTVAGGVAGWHIHGHGAVVFQK